ncbi:MAG TPA: methyltransferase domain-containing protein [Actinomycetota bacterium]|nr:methyltransferase domain-containing protein [Actinomycetota bacterium]
MFDHMLEYARIRAGARALEIGAGTGKATAALARRGVAILSLEPDARMAAVGRRNCAAFPHVSFLETSLEEWVAEPGRFQLVFSGQAWHWVSPEVAFPRAAEALEAGGTLALFWNRPRWRPSALRAALDEVYAAHAPEIEVSGSGFAGREHDGEGAPSVDDEQGAAITASGLFRDVEVRACAWSESFSSSRYVELLSTHSDHRILPEARREALFDAVAGLVDAAGGITVEYSTELYLARRV